MLGLRSAGVDKPADCMSIVLDGGLANQLFQRVAACLLLSRHGACVHFSTRWLGTGASMGVTPRTLEIDLKPDELDPDSVPPRLAVHLAKKTGISPTHWLVERDSADDPLARWTPRHRWAFGFYQRLDYVEEAWDSFAPYLPRGPDGCALSDVPRREGIAIHYRLGDHLGNPRARRFHGPTHPGYFAEATRMLVEEGIPSVVTLVSDDPAEARRRLTLAGMPRSICFRDEPVHSSAWADLALLAGSDALVLSNSTYSWWGAYLAWRNHQARVIRPTPWYATPSIVEPPLFPAAWSALRRVIVR